MDGWHVATMPKPGWLQDRGPQALRHQMMSVCYHPSYILQLPHHQLVAQTCHITILTSAYPLTCYHMATRSWQLDRLIFSIHFYHLKNLDWLEILRETKWLVDKKKKIVFYLKRFKNIFSLFYVIKLSRHKIILIPFSTLNQIPIDLTFPRVSI